MRELPVQHRADAVGADDEVAVAEIACTSVTSCDGPGSWSRNQRNASSNTGRGSKAAVFPLEIGNLPGRLISRSFGNFAAGIP